MSLLEDIGQEQRKTIPNRCPVAKLPTQLDPADWKDLEAAMADETIRHVAISRALRARGISLNEKALAAHRQGTCGCARG